MFKIFVHKKCLTEIKGAAMTLVMTEIMLMMLIYVIRHNVYTYKSEPTISCHHDLLSMIFIHDVATFFIIYNFSST